MDKEGNRFLKGSCLTMCPHAEVQLRLKLGLGHKLEKKVINGVRTEFADPRLMVKEFSRSSAGQKIKSSDVRPIPVLMKTVKYIFSVVCSFEGVTWLEIYDFVSNRLRAVHQDVIVQGGSGEEVIHMLSSAAKFYVYSHYRLCENECSSFDPHLNLQQLREVLLTILPMIRVRLLASYTQMEVLAHQINNISIGKSYSDQNYCKDLKVTLTPKSPVPMFLDKKENKYELCRIEDDIKKNHVFVDLSLYEEIISLHMLMNIGKPEVIFEIMELPKEVRAGPLKMIIKAVISNFYGNHRPLVRLATQLPPILSVALALQLNEVQRIVLGSWSVAYNSLNLSFKIGDLKKLLLFPSEKSLLQACQHYGISTSEAGVKFIKGNFTWSASALPPERADWVEEKLKIFPISQIFLATIPYC